VDELYEQPYTPVDKEGTPLAYYADFEISAAITTADCWEAAFRVERMKRINAEVRKQETIDQQQVRCVTVYMRKLQFNRRTFRRLTGNDR
jgi:hypothetical protein